MKRYVYRVTTIASVFFFPLNLYLWRNITRLTSLDEGTTCFQHGVMYLSKVSRRDHHGWNFSQEVESNYWLTLYFIFSNYFSFFYTTCYTVPNISLKLIYIHRFNSCTNKSINDLQHKLQCHYPALHVFDCVISLCLLMCNDWINKDIVYLFGLVVNRKHEKSEILCHSCIL